MQLTAALLTFGFAAVFDLLFFVVNDLPATVPVALALLVMEIRPLRRDSDGGRGRAGVTRWGAIGLAARACGGALAASAGPECCVVDPVEAGGRDSSASEVIARAPCAASSRTSVASSAERA